MSRCVFVLRGVSGSGKSTYARKLLEAAKALGVPALVVSADDYFTDPVSGEYVYDISKIGEAHLTCFRTFVEHVTQGWSTGTQPEHALIVVDNTNVRSLDVSPYMMAAAAYGWEAEIHQLTCDPEVALARNKHGVTDTIIQEMAERIAKYPLPGFWTTVEVPPDSF